MGTDVTHFFQADEYDLRVEGLQLWHIMAEDSCETPLAMSRSPRLNMLAGSSSSIEFEDEGCSLRLCAGSEDVAVESVPVSGSGVGWATMGSRANWVQSRLLSSLCPGGVWLALCQSILLVGLVSTLPINTIGRSTIVGLN